MSISSNPSLSENYVSNNITENNSKSFSVIYYCTLCVMWLWFIDKNFPFRIYRWANKIICDNEYAIIIWLKYRFFPLYNRSHGKFDSIRDYIQLHNRGIVWEWSSLTSKHGAKTRYISLHIANRVVLLQCLWWERPEEKILIL